ncbi:hypothetical protein LY76DRAFT_390899 [Colletotrichum caudatum]|nr:hypothetical protein LY76DRAFT_390899 [Colletotrichum caudatum]
MANTLSGTPCIVSQPSNAPAIVTSISFTLAKSVHMYVWARLWLAGGFQWLVFFVRVWFVLSAAASWVLQRCPSLDRCRLGPAPYVSYPYLARDKEGLMNADHRLIRQRACACAYVRVVYVRETRTGSGTATRESWGFPLSLSLSLYFSLWWRPRRDFEEAGRSRFDVGRGAYIMTVVSIQPEGCRFCTRWLEVKMAVYVTIQD